MTRLLVSVLVSLSLVLASCISSDSKAEEYYALGIAYFKLQKYSEAEQWFSRAKFHTATKTASEYYLGCIAYETGEYKDALVYFEKILNRDPENITALKAAAYTCIRTDNLEKSVLYYQRILGLVPESYDEGYNYALVLLAMNQSEAAEKILVKYNNTENPEALLLLARAQREQGKPEAADTYSASLLKDADPRVRMEYADFLAEQGLPSKALDEYKLALESEEITEDRKAEIQQKIDTLETNGQGGPEIQHKTD
jgi:tetratricopeptide (TPR) repeat protein